MSKADNFKDEKILVDAIEIIKSTNSEYMSAINKCIDESVLNEFQLILSEKLDILKNLKEEAVKRELIDNTPASNSEIEKVKAKYS